MMDGLPMEGMGERAFYSPALSGPPGRWVTLAPMPTGANHVSVAAYAGKIYALGGFIGQNKDAIDHAYAYDVTSNSWTTLPPLPRPRGAASARSTQ